MNKKTFLEIVKQCNFKVHGSFKNIYGEEYIVYQYTDDVINNPIFVTGDELGWECGYWYSWEYKLLLKDFVLNKEEHTEVLKIIREIKTDEE